MAVTSEERPRTSFSAVDIGDPLLEQQSNTFGHFVEEQQKSSTPFGQEHKSNASNAMKVTKSQAGEETLGDSEALRGWRDVSVLLPMLVTSNFTKKRLQPLIALLLTPCAALFG